ncbi:BQ5605_C040g11875 [Microbotryum silenes-dioicae]|uniref:BQ5605_C040g11875 protein n=1 Tax=Microbotryum silenes-dioicae TaxID=796604 RepID=A0A2X0MU63_9BASI|nr:BQ5605_C040g11875 [Microbotryum silenes-dioicae]
MGIPLRVLLDKHDRFMPATISDYYRFLEDRHRGRIPVHYHESEVIWRAVSEATWAELEAYLDAFEERRKQRCDEIRRNWSYNIFSAEVRDDWKTLWRSQLDEDPVVFQIEEWTGFCIHQGRKRYIKWYNKQYRDVRPPLYLSDNLSVELVPYGGLRSWAERRRAWFEGIGSSIANKYHSGHLSNYEIRHLRRKGVHFGIDPVVGFEKIVNTRAEASTEVLGPSELLPDSKLAETAKAQDDLSKNGQHRTLTLSRL